MSTRDIIEAANPCNVCSPELRSTCESLGRCDTRDAWRLVELKTALMEAVCKEAGTGHTWSGGCGLCDALDALAAWRKEHGDE